MNQKELLNKLLEQMLGNKQIVMLWWKSPNKAFAAKTPISYWKAGSKARSEVICYVLAMALR